MEHTDSFQSHTNIKDQPGLVFFGRRERKPCRFPLTDSLSLQGITQSGKAVLRDFI
jgi:hypothetical protein